MRYAANRRTGKKMLPPRRSAHVPELPHRQGYIIRMLGTKRGNVLFFKLEFFFRNKQQFDVFYYLFQGFGASMKISKDN
jgi:hypothetical protein